MELDRITTANNPRAIWFYVDIHFYVQQCITKGIALDSVDRDYIPSHYREYGGLHRLSPNPFFDEARYRKQYSWVESDVARGRCRSGFEHYLRNGLLENASPHWIFDPVWYRQQYPDVNERTLDLMAYDDFYGHFLATGTSEGRAGSALIGYILGVREPASRIGSAAELRSVLLDPAALARFLAPAFDTEWFAAKYNLIPQALSCFQFYRENARAEQLSPSPMFDEEYYRIQYPDVGAEVAAGSYSSGYEHFLQHGRREGRRPLANFDPGYYMEANPGVAEECRTERLDFFTHFARNRGRRLLIEPPFAKRSVEEAAGKAIFERRSTLVSQVTGLHYRDETPLPDVSVIVVAMNKFAETINALHSVAANSRRTYEFIVYDNGSTDGIADIPQRFPHVKYLRAERNMGFTIAVNQAAAVATGRHILLLNNDAEIGPGALDRAVGLLDTHPGIGAVGGRIIRTHGLLQEAGSLIWRDGSCLGYGRDLDPLDGRADFMRDVDFCSGCFLMTPRALWQELGGFDPNFAPAYYEETDYCVRVWGHGKRVVYDPHILVWHFEFGSSRLRDEPIALMRRNLTYFSTKHRTFLASRIPSAEQNIEAARLLHLPHPRVLFIEDELPDARQGMGFVRSSSVARVLEDRAGHVTLCGLHPPKYRNAGELRSTFGDRTEVLGDVNHITMVDELRRRIGVYDVVWLSRTHNLPMLRRWRAEVPAFFEGVRVILDTEAIAAARVTAQANLMGQVIDVDGLLDVELNGLDLVDDVCVVNRVDGDLVRGYQMRHGLDSRIHVLGHAMLPRATVSEYADTRTIALVGSFFNRAGPNSDAAKWFDRKVVPLLKRTWPQPALLVAGFKAREFVDHLDTDNEYEVMSDLRSMDPVYQSARIVVAPTRFAGGIPYKVHEACSYGVPVVMSALLGRQLGWTGNAALGIVAEDTPEAFAAMIVHLFFNQEAWNACRLAQFQHQIEDCDSGNFEASIRDLIVGNVD